MSRVYQHVYLTHLLLETSTSRWVFHQLKRQIFGFKRQNITLNSYHCHNVKTSVAESAVKDVSVFCLPHIFGSSP